MKFSQALDEYLDLRNNPKLEYDEDAKCDTYTKYHRRMRRLREIMDNHFEAISLHTEGDFTVIGRMRK